MQVLRAMSHRMPSDLRTLCTEIPITYPRDRGSEGLEEALVRIGQTAIDAVRTGTSVLVLSDRSASATHPPIPSLLALRSVVTTLNRNGHRLEASLVVEAGDVRSTHALACTIGFGATAVCPRLALEIARFEAPTADEAEVREAQLIQALLGGLLKIMAKMGISVVRSYQSSKLPAGNSSSSARCSSVPGRGPSAGSCPPLCLPPTSSRSARGRGALRTPQTGNATS
jgi:hypothetical protein